MVSLKSFGITLSHRGGKLKIAAMATAVTNSKQNLVTYWLKSGDVKNLASKNGLKRVYQTLIQIKSGILSFDTPDGAFCKLGIYYKWSRTPRSQLLKLDCESLPPVKHFFQK